MDEQFLIKRPKSQNIAKKNQNFNPLKIQNCRLHHNIAKSDLYDYMVAVDKISKKSDQ